MKTNIHFWSYLTHFFSELETFKTNGAEKIITHILCSITFLEKTHRFWDNVEYIVELGRPYIKILPRALHAG